jgi:FAD/FMN-containing dehydrogenase
VGAAMELSAALRSQVPSLEAAELMLREGLELVEAEGFASSPFDAPHPAYVLAECAARTDPTDELAEAVEALEVRDVAVATDAAQRAALWACREGHTEAINRRGVPHKLDVSLPLRAIPAFVDELRESEAIVFGHAGDGNLHVNLLGLEPDDEEPDERVLRLVAGHGGSVSAEHGIGVAKARWLHLTRSADEIEAMRAIKRALDPDGILNPGVILAAG